MPFSFYLAGRHQHRAVLPHACDVRYCVAYLLRTLRTLRCVEWKPRFNRCLHRGRSHRELERRRIKEFLRLRMLETSCSVLRSNDAWRMIGQSADHAIPARHRLTAPLYNAAQKPRALCRPTTDL